MLTDRQLFLNNLAQTSDSPLALEITRAEGIYLYDASGKKYIDLISGISVSNTGHRHPKVIKAIKDQADKYLHLMVYGEYIQSPQVKLAGALADLLPEKLNNCYFVNSGSEAVEGAMKLAKRYTGRGGIVAFNNAYHGSTQGALSVIGNENYQLPFGPLLPEITHIEFNSVESLRFITSETACVIIEPVQGEAGIIAGTREFLTALRNRCNETGALLIFDEIQTGMGRTGYMFAFEKYQVIPDILLLAKGLGGGMPIGAFISSHEIMQSLTFNPVLGHITTFGGHPVSCAAALANIEVIINEKLVENVEAKSNLIIQLLSKSKAISQIRSAGLLIALQLDNYTHVKRVIDRCIDNGVILDWFLFNDSSIRIAPPLTITEAQIKEACNTIFKALIEV
ncbi:MAG: aspartate aminotransferase family protein [Lentimicrobiaceae bacterium]|jgi:acetylornithine/succinyldiaminopimelate/putrescine aminotransferase